MSEHKSVSQADIQCLLEGSAPCSDAGIAAVTVGTERLSAFLRDQYLKDYIPQGGSKLKFVCGRQGAGKTHFARQMMIEAKKLSYRVVHFSAANLSMHDFREVYLEILRQCDIDCVLQGCAREAVRRMGYDPDTIRAGMKYVDMLAEQGEADGLTAYATVCEKCLFAMRVWITVLLTVSVSLQVTSWATLCWNHRTENCLNAICWAIKM